MVEPPPAVLFLPIGAVGPPRPVALRRGDELAAQIDPAVSIAKTPQRLDLYWRVADHLDQCLVIVNVAFQRGDVEVADQQRRPVELVGPAGSSARGKSSFWPNLGLAVRSANVAARGDIDVIQHQPLPLRPSSSTPTCRASPLSCQSCRLNFAQRDAADRGDAVVALLPVHRAVGVAQPPRTPHAGTGARPS